MVEGEFGILFPGFVLPSGSIPPRPSLSGSPGSAEAGLVRIAVLSITKGIVNKVLNPLKVAKVTKAVVKVFLFTIVNPSIILLSFLICLQVEIGCYLLLRSISKFYSPSAQQSLQPIPVNSYDRTIHAPVFVRQ